MSLWLRHPTLQQRTGWMADRLRNKAGRHCGWLRDAGTRRLALKLLHGSSSASYSSLGLWQDAYDMCIIHGPYTYIQIKEYACVLCGHVCGHVFYAYSAGKYVMRILQACVHACMLRVLCRHVCSHVCYVYYAGMHAMHIIQAYIYVCTPTCVHAYMHTYVHTLHSVTLHTYMHA